MNSVNVSEWGAQLVPGLVRSKHLIHPHHQQVKPEHTTQDEKRVKKVGLIEQAVCGISAETGLKCRDSVCKGCRAALPGTCLLSGTHQL